MTTKIYCDIYKKECGEESADFYIYYHSLMGHVRKEFCSRECLKKFVSEEL